MTVETNNNETIIRIPSSVGSQLIQDFMDYLSVKSIVSQSQATDEAINQLAEEAQENWWENNKTRFLK